MRTRKEFLIDFFSTVFGDELRDLEKYYLSQKGDKPSEEEVESSQELLRKAFDDIVYGSTGFEWRRYEEEMPPTYVPLLVLDTDMKVYVGQYGDDEFFYQSNAMKFVPTATHWCRISYPRR